ncbi:hypothetical protein FE782_07900 [Paenibacillus antri]|uniref:ParB/Sulfiredoxin domain-containing protein n=1 Tax=Paenibacillus antri TaxID=2582848 RepID=A0A5R9G819_9BACL|nr:hypothetical protein [Paenibacillus antri]TLS52552.1 hypothetical protein FE782_07900 [Paenibacillus antri]
MRFTIQYIPLKKIDASATVRITERIKQLRAVVWDSSNLLAVKKNRRDGSFIVVGGHDRYRYMKAHTNKLYAPCVLDETKESSAASLPSWIRKFRNRNLPKKFPKFHPEKITPAGWSIIRAFAKEEPRFERLTRLQQVKVLLVAVRYKKTVVKAMRAMVDDMTGSDG